MTAPPLLSRFIARTRSAGPDELLTGPLRGELLGPEGLADRARALAAQQRVGRQTGARRRPRLLHRLDQTRRILDDAHAQLAAAADRELNVGPAGEWLLDNLHVVHEHIREVRDSLPRGYYRELPELASGALAGFPRVYELAITLISHTEARLELHSLDAFVRAFQQVASLSIGELWAVPAMLRLGLIESVRRMTLRTVQRLKELDAADAWAARLVDAAADPAALTAALNDLVTDPPPFTATFVSRFLHRIRTAPVTIPPRAWLEQWIAEQSVHPEEAAARATERVALTQVMMANSITSLRAIAHMEWETFVEQQSVMDAVLREDPAGAYPRMTFATRDRYRHVVERIAKRTGRDEAGVARSALDLARAASGTIPGERRHAHVGYYLVDDGLAALERRSGYRPTTREWLYRAVLRHPNVLFVGGIVAGTLAALGIAFWLAGPEARAAWLLVALFAFIPANDIAVTVMNQLVTGFLPPRVIPKLDLAEHGGIPPDLRTAVVVPTLFGSVDAVREALDHLEIQFLANREPHLHFAVLSDFTDAPAESCDGDAAILAAAIAGVRALNSRYAAGRDDGFYLFHRPRRWNPREGVWMGWERKRGKLAEFNRFLRGGTTEAFSAIVGDDRTIRRSRYVITLDADTMLPPGAASLLVGALAHPLNRAVYDPALGRVAQGYSVLQPRVGVSLTSAHSSQFAAVQSGHPGVDPYTTAVSDVYQDLYGEGSFTGKGIYDVEAFEQATHERFPENTLLSHDLIEGNYARAGLVTDIVLYDDYPARYLTYTRRKHRWIRGDWQLLRWLGRRVPGPDGPEPNRLSVLSRWKILDNLRRSLVEIAQFGLVVAGWTVLPGQPLRWTLLAVGAIAAPWVVATLLAVLRPPTRKSWGPYYAAVWHDAAVGIQQVSLAVMFLPHQAWVSADAITRTLWRQFVSGRRLLEWQTASQTERTAAGGARAAWRTMWPAVAIAVALLAAVAWLDLAANGARSWPTIGAALPVLALWLASPAIAYAISAPAVRRERRLPPESRGAALRYALIHWRFFERFVTEETNWLAPDNFQEDPNPVVAMRTSPTNIGLQLLATASARELGFIGIEEMTGRLERAFRSLERMRRFRGHFYNWYELRDLQVLEPAYVSTVDSGNLAGHLIALHHACRGMLDEPVLDASVWSGLAAAVGLAREGLRDVPAADRELRDAARALRDSAGVMSFELVTAALHRADEALRLSGAAGPEVEAAAEWIGWVRDSIAQHARWMDQLEFQPAAGRAGSPALRSESLRSLAARSAPAAELMDRLAALADRAYAYAMEMDFRPLYDESRSLFTIGYQPGAPSTDGSHYDLLASEARLASYLAVAKGEAPPDHWFRLGRTLTRAAGETALVSWSGSMFEYLMPLLVMRSVPYTVLDETYRGAVRRHIAYGAERNVPWGVSESAFNLRDRYLTYQYRAFGVPDLALKRGLGRDLVIAPYASALAAMVAPASAIANLGALEQLGALGRYGFLEALDYTRPAPGRRFALVQTYMAHHVGMSLVALTNAVTGGIWQRRFHGDAMIRAAELLLHERVPRRLELQAPQASRADEALPDPELERPVVREVDVADTPQPHIALLGHLPYSIMLSHSGSGYSRYENLAVTRWRADGTRDHTGQFCYVRDLTGGRVWATAHQPVCAPPDRFSVLLATDRVTFHRMDGEIETRTEIAVVPGDAAEVRRVTVTNNGSTPRDLELTSYGEIVLAPPDADRAHPAFGNLFVETEWHEWCDAITATRRPRSAGEPPLCCVHVVDTGPERIGPVTCETDRARFIGRGRTTRDPIALEAHGDLSNTTGPVLDPIFAIRARVRLEPRQSASVAFTTLVATTRQRAFELADRYHDRHAGQRALDLAWTAAQVELRELNVSPAEAGVFQELAGHLFYSNAALRAPAEELLLNRGSQPLLWAAGVSGDWPIVLATIDSPEGLPTLRQLLTAHHYWRRRGMMVDVVVLNLRPPSYLQDLEHQIQSALHNSPAVAVVDQPGGVFARRRDLLAPDVVAMLRATARLHVTCDGRSLGNVAAAAAAAGEMEDEEPPPAPLRPSGRHTAPGLLTLLRVRALSTARSLLESPDAAFDHATGGGRRVRPARGAGPDAGNGYGTITAGGDYEIHVEGDHVPPAPWANVIANPRGGFLVTERGGGFTWSENSYFFRLTPWSNDPVSDPLGEALYLRDETTGEVWSPAPAPLRGDGRYTVRHSPGRSTIEHERDGIATGLALGIAEEHAVKLSVLRLTNTGDIPRRLTLTAYIEWTLGVLREHTQHQVRTAFDPEHEAILAWNTFDPHFAGRVAFAALSEPLAEHTADRREFLGRNGSVANPAGLHAVLSGAAGAGLDPCAALRSVLELAPGESREVAIVLGAGNDEADARRLLAEFRDVARARGAMAGTVDAWTRRLSVIAVRTPDPAFDVMLNRWTLYQALACRVWGRSAVYQSSGAYGFRDQLQDVMALVYAEPALAREHILRAAGRQFVEGDVQHWWHPQSGRGVRTRFSDDLAWLPYVVDHYLVVTGDRGVLDESVPFLTMRPLEPHEHEVYDAPTVSEETGSVYQHCLRALRKAGTAGAHGLPLIGGGDWNDGMNRVGVDGRGESVWLAWFLAATARRFAAHADARGDAAAAAELRERADRYVAAVEAHGWDGEWYRRAYFDDGTPLGTAADAECRIDSIAQSWSVIAGGGAAERRARAMRSVEALLVREHDRVLPLLTPPFDVTPRDPGYIKGYLPGVRENGAQYTHAALWVVLATALQRRDGRAFELFRMLNPLTHTETPEGVARYQVEPYVVAADVYTAPGHVGRGGWTWYTGSASWMYRVALEAILGFTKRGDTLTIDPRVPAEWPEFAIEYRYGSSVYAIVVQEPGAAVSGMQEVTVDGQRLEGEAIRLVDDGARHEVAIRHKPQRAYVTS